MNPGILLKDSMETVPKGLVEDCGSLVPLSTAQEDQIRRVPVIEGGDRQR